MESNGTNVVLKALSDIRRRQILAIKFNPQTSDLYDDAFVHAVTHSIYPIRHEHPGFKETTAERLAAFPFYETYDCGYELVTRIFKLLDEKFVAKQKITYYDVEGPYKIHGQHWEGADIREDLINICRYFYLANVFDDHDFWKNFMSDAPTEAASLTDPWSREEIETYIEIGGA